MVVELAVDFDEFSVEFERLLFLSLELSLTFLVLSSQLIQFLPDGRVILILGDAIFFFKQVLEGTALIDFVAVLVKLQCLDIDLHALVLDLQSVYLFPAVLGLLPELLVRAHQLIVPIHQLLVATCYLLMVGFENVYFLIFPYYLLL